MQVKCWLVAIDRNDGSATTDRPSKNVIEAARSDVRNVKKATAVKASSAPTSAPAPAFTPAPTSTFTTFSAIDRMAEIMILGALQKQQEKEDKRIKRLIRRKNWNINRS